MNWSIGRGPTIAFVLVFTVLVANGVVDYWNTARLHQQGDTFARMRELRRELEGVFSTLKDAEIGQRDYVLSGDDRDLEAYREAIDGVSARLEPLRELIADEPAQTERLASLERAVSTVLRELQATVALRQTRGFDAARRYLLTDEGKKATERIRVMVDQFHNEEAVQLAARRQAAAANYTITLITNGAALLLGVTIIGLAHYLTGRELAARKRVEDVLRMSGERLRLALESANQGTWDCNLIAGEVFLDERCGDILGLSKSSKVDFDAAIASIHPHDRLAFDKARKTGCGRSRCRGFPPGSPHRRTQWIDILGGDARPRVFRGRRNWPPGRAIYRRESGHHRAQAGRGATPATQ